MEELIFDRTQLDLINDTSKGNYNASDLNRVESWCGYLAELLTSYGYFIYITVKTDWTMADMPYALDMERIRSNVEKIKQTYYSYLDTPDTPDTLNRVDIKKANSIEKILFDIDELINKMGAEFRKCGTFNSGGMEGLI